MKVSGYWGEYLAISVIAMIISPWGEYRGHLYVLDRGAISRRAGRSGVISIVAKVADVGHARHDHPRSPDLQINRSTDVSGLSVLLVSGGVGWVIGRVVVLVPRLNLPYAGDDRRSNSLNTAIDPTNS